MGRVYETFRFDSTHFYAAVTMNGLPPRTIGRISATKKPFNCFSSKRRTTAGPRATRNGEHLSLAVAICGQPHAPLGPLPTQIYQVLLQNLDRAQRKVRSHGSGARRSTDRG